MDVKNELGRLITRYHWLRDEQRVHRRGGATANAAHIADAMDEVFLEILAYPASDPTVSCCQIEFLLSVLTETSTDRKLRELLRDQVLVHVRKLANDASGGRSVALVAAE